MESKEMEYQTQNIANRSDGLKAVSDTGPSLLNKETVNYWFSPSLIIAYGMACVEIVLLRSDRANELYQNVVQSWALPGCKRLWEAGLQCIPNAPYPNLVEDYIKLITGQQSIDNREPFQGLISWLLSDSFLQLADHPDLQLQMNQVRELILVGFNRKVDQDNKAWKVTPGNSPIYALNVIIGFRSAASYFKVCPQSLFQLKVQINDTTYGLNGTPRNPTTRIERSVREAAIGPFRENDFKLRHDETLLRDADKWYKCRVDPGSIELYIDDLAGQGIYVDRGRIENNIAGYDRATGYPRKWRK